MTFEEYARAHDLYFTEDYESDEFQIAREAWDAAYEQGAEDSLSVAYMAGLKDASSRKLPEGYVLVPVEPTEAMVEEGEIAYVHGGTIEAVYGAMIKAAQEEE